MQKPAAYRASVLVLLLVLLKTSIKITSADGVVCLDPGSGGTYNVACSRATVSDAPRRLAHLLAVIRYEYINVFPYATPCMNPLRRADQSIMGYGYAFCWKGTSRDSCLECLESARQVILGTCDPDVAGAQASSEGCCIRYENEPFCTP
ncbi:hypothetical protein LINGRAHAP2_LOCUS12160 [Linum grandiflorum]